MAGSRIIIFFNFHFKPKTKTQNHFLVFLPRSHVKSSVDATVSNLTHAWLFFIVHLTMFTACSSFIPLTYYRVIVLTINMKFESALLFVPCEVFWCIMIKSMQSLSMPFLRCLSSTKLQKLVVVFSLLYFGLTIW